MHKFWYDNVKPKYGETTNLVYMDTGSSIVYIKAKDIYIDTERDIQTRFNISNYELGRPFPKEENKKIIWLVKNDLEVKK